MERRIDDLGLASGSAATGLPDSCSSPTTAAAPPGAAPPMWAQIQDELREHGIIAPPVDVVNGPGGAATGELRRVLQLVARHDPVLVARNLLNLAASGAERQNACEAAVRPGLAGHAAPKQDPGTAPAGKTGTVTGQPVTAA